MLATDSHQAAFRHKGPFAGGGSIGEIPIQGFVARKHSSFLASHTLNTYLDQVNFHKKTEWAQSGQCSVGTIHNMKDTL